MITRFRRVTDFILLTGHFKLWTTLLSAAAFAMSMATAYAQAPAKMFRIAILAYDQNLSSLQPFFDEIQRLGYVADQNAKIELWNAQGQASQLPKLVEEIGQFAPDVILATATPAALAAKKLMPAVPAVFTLVADPIRSRLVASFAKPGGNMTGLTNMNIELSGKRTEILLEAIPSAKRIGVLTNPSDPISDPQLQEITRTARAGKVRLVALTAREPKDVQQLRAALAKDPVDGLTLVSSQLFTGHQSLLTSIVAATKTPTIYWTSTFVNSGGLMSYGVNAAELYRRAATYVDKILKGAKPAELPVEQPAKFEFIVNLNAAKKIALVIPPNLLARADRVLK
jgi:putative ABC transport system substrate-binding protein